MTIAIPSNRVISAVSKDGGGFQSAGLAGTPVSGFVAESGFTLEDNGDGTLSISDAQSRFGTKPNAALPVWFLDFGSGSDQPHPTLSRQQKVLSWASQCEPTTTVKKTGSTHSMTIDTAQADGSNSIFQTGDDTLTLPGNAGRKFFRYYDVYNDFTSDELDASITANTPSTLPNMKTHRWQSAGAQTDPYTVNTLQAHEYKFAFSGGGVTEILYDKRSALGSPVWHVEEEYHEVSSGADAADAQMVGVLDGEQAFTMMGVVSHSNSLDPASEQGRWDHYKIANFRLWAAPGECPWRANVLYVDDSWCRVYITDKATWSDAEKKLMEIQVPTAWAAAALTFHQRTGQFTDLSGKYLWVADNDDTKILIGGWS